MKTKDVTAAPPHRETRQERENRLQREETARLKAAAEAKKEKLAAIRQQVQVREAGRAATAHPELMMMVVETKGRALAARRIATEASIGHPRAYHPKLTEQWERNQEARAAAIAACEEFRTAGEALWVASEVELKAAVERHKSELERLQREAMEMPGRVSQALVSSSIEVVGDLQTQQRALPAVLASTEVLLWEAELALEQGQKPLLDAEAWLENENNLLNRERLDYELACRDFTGMTANRASAAAGRCHDRIHALEQRVAEARRNMESETRATVQTAQRVAALAENSRR